MANTNECFSDFCKQKTAKKRWHSLVSRMGVGEEYLESPFPSPRVCTDGRTFARSYADVITKFSRLDGLPIFLTRGALLARFARWSSAKNSSASPTPRGNTFFWRHSNWSVVVTTRLSWLRLIDESIGVFGVVLGRKVLLILHTFLWVWPSKWIF